MRRLRFCLILGAVWLLTASVAHPQATTRQEREVREAGRRLAAMAIEDSLWLASSPLCTLPDLVDTVGWRRSPPRSIVLLPPRFQRDTSYRGVHGGARWVAGPDTVDLGTGYWRVRSFSDNPELKRCKATVGGAPMLIMEDSARRQLLGWAFRAPPNQFSPLFIASGPNRATYLTILHHLTVARFRPIPCKPHFDRVDVDLFAGLLPSNVHWSGRVRMTDCAATPRTVIPARAAQLGR